eukprot:8045751-Lingulodinium_polyedra.AAC.1
MHAQPHKKGMSLLSCLRRSQLQWPRDVRSLVSALAPCRMYRRQERSSAHRPKRRMASGLTPPSARAVAPPRRSEC